MRYEGWYVYILASDSGVLYTGMSKDLRRRVLQHRSRRPGSFTGKYRVTRLVYFEIAWTPSAAIEREKEIKSWRRERRVRLIEAQNPGWRDLAVDW